MTKSQKLKKIIEFAVERGWEDKLFWAKDLPAIKKLDDWAYDAWVINLLFSHDFAKAVFGKGSVDNVKIIVESGGDTLGEPWEHHLQQAVIEKDPIDYYYKYVKTK